jgi:hypothetical protein
MLLPGRMQGRHSTFDFEAKEIGADMSNVPTYEPEITPVEKGNPTAIRDAIAAIIPKDDNIVSDIKVHDGIADISIRWRSLRWSVGYSISGSKPDVIAQNVSDMFRKWLVKTVDNMYDSDGKAVPRHARAAADMKGWLKANPDKRKWMYGSEA